MKNLQKQTAVHQKPALAAALAHVNKQSLEKTSVSHRQNKKSALHFWRADF
ncbi:hypothetical protein [Chitinimonas sp. BJB300]|uniref:hypothetical protein n=1 Tax=Chitinimonas sp. BJB300 TaxID=1559339 RepID=UPI001303FDCE|nr:hypothetical protein [Chitinimonas sp. BJB300]